MDLERRFSGGLSFLTALTIAKALDDSSGVFGDNDHGGAVSPDNSHNFSAEKALSDFHVGKRSVSSFVWELPFGRGRKLGTAWHGAVNQVLGGWQVNGVLTCQDGLPFAPQGPDRTNGAGGTRPDRVGNGNLPASQRSLTNWFDKTAFSVPNLYTFGNSGRNVLFEPGLVNLDFSVFKSFKLRERFELQYRAEFFNSTNTPYFELSNRRIDLPSGGVISIARAPRNVQMGLKLLF